MLRGPAAAQSLCTGDGLPSISERNAIRITDVKSDRAIKFQRCFMRYRVECIKESLDRGATWVSIHDLTKSGEIQIQDVSVSNSSCAMPLLNAVDGCRAGKPLEYKRLNQGGLNFGCRC